MLLRMIMIERLIEISHQISLPGLVVSDEKAVSLKLNAMSDEELLTIYERSLATCFSMENS